MDKNKEILIYGYITNVILSTEKFKNNIDIKEFLENETSLFLNDDEKFKDYVYKTRTLILARAIRITEKREDKTLLFNEFKAAIYNINKSKDTIINDDVKPKNTKKKKRNKFDDLLDQFER
ncbi:hypothetical protein JTF04_02510 [Mammaliicoccus vitulinus]|uniref:hypothetical protein n=1 Tax=Mammaliicoccus vitulinus TaxID=71237 RepID=UPI00194EDBAE|nr:hypothetical protein [Mammaliicoccus vitulinus]MBM6628540.1 hypothetical protein [Mammaliicoccus vitulinus]